MWLLYGAILLAISLSIDAFAIGLSYRLRNIKMTLMSKLIICTVSTLVMWISVIIGDIILKYVPVGMSKILGCLMLFVLGMWIVVHELLNIGDPTNNPLDCDIDNSKYLDVTESVYLAVALSIDSFVAGISAAISGLNIIIIPIATGVFQLLFLCVGEFVGKVLSDKFKCKLNYKIFTFLSGAILMALALVRYFF